MTLRQLLKTTTLSLPLAFFLGCSGGGGGGDSQTPSNPQTLTGILVDSAVSGVDYNCSSGTTGVTNDAGEFTCKTGDTVAFSLAGVALGSVPVGSIITPTTLFPNNPAAALNFAQLLQTFDSDPATDGISLEGIDLTDFITNMGGVENIDFSASDFDAVVSAALPAGTTLVSEADAQEHLNETFTTLGINADGTQIVVNPDDSNTTVPDDGNTTVPDDSNTTVPSDTTAPTFTSSNAISVNENVTNVMSVTTDDATATLILSGADATKFNLASNGTLSFNVAPDFETDAHSYSVTITARDTASNESTQAITITLLDVDETIPDTTAPSFTSADTFNILENTTTVGTVIVDEVATLTLGGTDAAAFTLTDGVLALKAPADFETKPSYSVTVTAKDSSNNETTQAITVKVMDLDEVAPTFTSEATFTADENQKAVGTVTTDDDTAILTLGGTDADFFTLTDGVVAFKVVPDFETKPSYSVTVTAKDSSNNETTQTIIVNVTDLDEVAPTFTSTNSITVPENQTSVTTVTTDDATATLTLGGTDAAAFTLTDGTLAFKVSPDFEAVPTKTSFEVTVTATDTLNNETTQTITVGVTDTNDNLPVFASVNYSPSVNENQITAITLSATDGDIGDILTYSLKAGVYDVAFMSIADGVVTFLSPADFESKPSYSFTAIASDGLHNIEQEIVISILDVDDTAPTFDSTVNYLVNEGAIAVGTLNTDDPSATFSLIGGDTDKFTITGNSLAFNVAANYETDALPSHEYSLTIEASDVDTNTRSKTFTIKLQNIRPTADAGVNQELEKDSTVTLDGSASGDTVGGDITYLWSFVSKPTQSTAMLSSESEENPTFVADKIGEYVLNLVVNDGYEESILSEVRVSATESIVHKGLTYKTVTSPTTAKVWLDRNMGATQACTAIDDSDCFGDYYQWGRKTDGHEKTTSTSSTTLATDVNNAGSEFILSSSDWTGIGVDRYGKERMYNWKNTDGNSVCPTGFRVPISDEFQAESLGNTLSDVFGGFLKIATAGSYDENKSFISTHAALWTSNPQEREIAIYDTKTEYFGQSRTYAQNVRCIADSNSAPLVDAGNNITLRTTETATLDGGGSSDADTGDTLTYLWEITSAPDGTSTSLSAVDTASPTLVPDLAGEYVVKLVVNDGHMDSLEESITITATGNSAPISNIGSYERVDVTSTSQSVQLDGSGSSDVDGDSIATYAWRVVSKPSGSSASLSDTSLVDPTILVDVDGNYKLGLIVNDGIDDSLEAFVTLEAGSEVSNSEGLTYMTITSPITGRVWLDRHLGATTACIPATTEACQGDNYQWGRLRDGHEKSTSSTTEVKLTVVDENNVNFIVDTTYQPTWLASGVDDDYSLRIVNWSKTDGNGICPIGYRVPIAEEVALELVNMENYYDGEESFLKLATNGGRNAKTQSLSYKAIMYTISLKEVYPNFYPIIQLLYSSGKSIGSGSYAGHAYPVRCIKD